MKLKRLGMYLTILAGTAAVLWGAQEVARSHPAPIRWHRVVVREPPPEPILQTPLRARGADFERALAWDPSPSRLAAFAVEPGGQLLVFDLRTGNALARLHVSSGVASAEWVSDRLMLILTGGGLLETYDVWNHVLRSIASLHPPAGMVYRAVAWSGYTNDLYVIFSSVWGNEVYYFDTNEHMYAESLGDLSIRQAYDGSTDLTLYVVDAHHRLWVDRAGLLRPVASQVALIRGAGNTIYCAELNARGEAVAVRAFDGRAWTTLCRLPSPVPASCLVIDHAGHTYIVSRQFIEDASGRVARAPQGAFFFASQSADAVVAVRGSAYGVVMD
ncbi:hypothetical protein [Alicyclobacillus acidocaldarius]|uniref:Uncharacterized protein n=1 Tax=Alicyclobacillus acidocaldarius subsp. acidocaldarius (strain ATCC 27009 / DSM 446 / BCRC 14685 / JCM 5260 / KCTC 1825 / NBRC 15652 / NCIMB 11725 / NRRL B-14509 / 104-IA) TaxID=521098 RepID=C8WU57_ALIAD|nr:hypothetical protein [Alicyclobacillus acidocaldarius]ACV57820.1 hypothetical protein Aaci_0777 [Alicyclobacillus acidocaldarius subsp. acidocaldarius DSM 446]